MISIRGPSMRRKLNGVPQAAQKSRSAIEEERNAAGWPRVQTKSLVSISAKEANGAPEAFWHIRQWQMLTLAGGAVSAKRTAPHWQPPVSTGFVAVGHGHSIRRRPLQHRQGVAAGEDEAR